MAGERILHAKEERRPASGRTGDTVDYPFMILVLLVSIFVNAFLSWDNLALRVAGKLLLLPVVMGVSYELIMLAGRYDNLFTRAFSAPGLWMQRLTTFEPDDSMIEVAIAAVKPVLPEKPEEYTYDN